MIFVLVLIQIVVSVSAGSAPQAPERVEVQDGLLSWAPAAVEDDVTHTVQFRLFPILSASITSTITEKVWSDLPQCVRITASVCNVSVLIREADHGCVGLRVRAQRGRLRSEATEACSVSEDRCTPWLDLSPAEGSLMVHLTRDHGLRREFGDHAQHQVCHWSLDQPKPVCTKTSSSLPISDLDPGRNYCVEVQFLSYSKLVGLPRCPVCREVPQPQSKHTGIVLGVVLPALMLAMGCGVVYVLMFHRKKIKKCLKPEREPDWLTLTPEGAPVCTPPEEPWDTIDGFRQIDQD